MHVAKYITEKLFLYHDSKQISVSVDTKVIMQRHQPLCVYSFTFLSCLPFFEITMTTRICERKSGKSIDKYNYLGSSYWCWKKIFIIRIVGKDKERNRGEKHRNNIFILSSPNREERT